MLFYLVLQYSERVSTEMFFRDPKKSGEKRGCPQKPHPHILSGGESSKMKNVQNLGIFFVGGTIFKTPIPTFGRQNVGMSSFKCVKPHPHFCRKATLPRCKRPKTSGFFSWEKQYLKLPSRLSVEKKSGCQFKNNLSDPIVFFNAASCSIFTTIHYVL